MGASPVRFWSGYHIVHFGGVKPRTVLYFGPVQQFFHLATGGWCLYWKKFSGSPVPNLSLRAKVQRNTHTCILCRLKLLIMKQKHDLPAVLRNMEVCCKCELFMSNNRAISHWENTTTGALELNLWMLNVHLWSLMYSRCDRFISAVIIHGK